MSRLALDGTVELVSRDQILRRVWGQGKYSFPCSADMMSKIGNHIGGCPICYMYVMTIHIHQVQSQCEE